MEMPELLERAHKLRHKYLNAVEGEYDANIIGKLIFALEDALDQLASTTQNPQISAAHSDNSDDFSTTPDYVQKGNSSTSTMSAEEVREAFKFVQRSGEGDYPLWLLVAVKKTLYRVCEDPELEDARAILDAIRAMPVTK